MFPRIAAMLSLFVALSQPAGAAVQPFPPAFKAQTIQTGDAVSMTDVGARAEKAAA